MSELKAKHVVDVYDDYAEHPCEELSQVYLKSEADKAVKEITEGAISMFRESNKCRGLDLKSPLGQIADAAFRHWNFVETVQAKNTQLQANIKDLLVINREQTNAANRLRDDMECIIRHHKYKRCLAMARLCMARYNEWAAYYPTTTTRIMKFLDKLEKRWLELAQQFKEAK